MPQTRWSMALALAVTTVAVYAARAQGPTYRSTAEVIPVDVEVVDKTGEPIAGLTPDKFEVKIDGRRHHVGSAEFIAYDSGTSPSESPLPPASPGASPPSTPRVQPAEARVIILALDLESLTFQNSHDAIEAAHAFLDRLAPTDRVGLFAYPLGPKIDPTVDHGAISRAIDTVTGQRGLSSTGFFNLSPSNLVDLSARSGSVAADLTDRLCGHDENCIRQLGDEALSEILSYEALSSTDTGMLQALVRGLASVPGRKILVLVSAGIPGADRPGLRPDLSDIGTEIGRAAAKADVSVYTLFLDEAWEMRTSAATARNPPPTDRGRDSVILSHWLDRFTDAAGGEFMRIGVGGGDSSFERILHETSAYYLLGVAPESIDRDGRPHRIKVTVNVPGATVRARAWVTVLKPGTLPPITQQASAAPAEPAAGLLAAPASTLPARAVPASLAGW